MTVLMVVVGLGRAGQAIGAEKDQAPGRCALAQAAPAPAPPLPARSVTTPSPAAKWYGYQLIITDLASFAILVAGGEWAALLPYAAALFVIHAAHRKTSMVIASPLLRVGLPLMLGGLLFATSTDTCPDHNRAMNGLTGAALGVFIAIVIDWIAARAPVASASPPAPPRGAASITAGLGCGSDHISMKLGGRF